MCVCMCVCVCEHVHVHVRVRACVRVRVRVRVSCHSGSMTWCAHACMCVCFHLLQSSERQQLVHIKCLRYFSSHLRVDDVMRQIQQEWHDLLHGGQLQKRFCNGQNEKLARESRYILLQLYTVFLFVCVLFCWFFCCVFFFFVWLFLLSVCC